eukprot:EG_transcript_11109
MPFVVLLLLAFMTPGLGGLSLPWGRRMAKTAWSSIRCVNASDPRQGRCFIRNAYIVDNVVWVVHPQRVEVPPLLCSAHDAPPEEARYCNATWRSPKDFITRLHLPLRVGEAQKTVQARLLSFDTGIVFSRLNPNNMYHAVMEDSLPLFELILDTPELQDWLLPPQNTTSRLLFFQEGYHNCHPGTELAELLYPGVQLVEGPHNPAILYHVKFLVMGSQTSCVHAKHCQRGHFRTPELGALFRRFALRRAGLSGDARPPRRARARVTVVKRTAPATRQIANLGDTVAAVNSAIAAFYGPGARNATVVDFTPLGLREQMLAMLRTDILVMVHGGVYGNTLFLPRHAIVVDIYPYAFHPEQHGYHLNGIHLTLPTMHYGQLHLETNDSSTTLAVGEWCYSGPCSGINTTKPQSFLPTLSTSPSSPLPPAQPPAPTA